jgi:formate dehydrogenase accessory protein FdhD
LVFGLNLSVASAGPIGLLAIAVAGSLGAINGLRTKLLRYRAALVMATLGVVLAPIGVYMAHRIPNQPLMIAFASILVIVSVRMLIQAQQEITALTGGAHAAAWVVDGHIVALFEDVGRHNALDKLLGYLAQENYDTSLGFVVMTSRASYELIRKCAQLNISLLASISAPTSMAIQLAKQSGLTLASFCRGDRFVLYTEI